MLSIDSHRPPHPSQDGAFTVALHFFQLLTDHCASRGLALNRLLATGGLPPSAAHADGNGRVPFLTFQHLCTVAAEALDDPDLGLRMGQAIRPGHLGSHGYALMNCRTAIDLARQSARYSALTIDACHNVIEQREDEFVRVVHSNLPGQASLGRICDDLQHAIAVTFGRWITARPDIHPRWVSFRYPRPADVREHEALFRCPLHFGAAQTAIAFDVGIASLPLPQADPQVRRIMEDLCAQLVRQLGDALEPGWLASARRATLDAFQHGTPEPEGVAATIGLETADLKALLAGRELSFRAFVDSLRRDLALGYMRDPSLSLVDIAFLLGFSEQSSFQRAFKRWTGKTPGEHRRAGGAVEAGRASV